jgi:hypothetical protein
MDASDCKFVGGPLLAMCLLMNGAATAMEPAQSAAAGQSSPALRLPTFLDQSRLADLQKAWRTRASNAPAPRVETGGAQQGEQQIQKAEATVSTARAAMKRAEQASQNAAAVRRRAEEISRRFSAEGVIAAPTATGATSNTAVSPTGGAGTPAQVSAASANRMAIAMRRPDRSRLGSVVRARRCGGGCAKRGDRENRESPAREGLFREPAAPKVAASNKVMANTQHCNTDARRKFAFRLRNGKGDNHKHYGRRLSNFMRVRLEPQPK